MNIYKSDNLALAPYLTLNGLKYIKKEATKENGKIKIYFIFQDDENKGEQLSLDFNRSDFKQYRDLTLFFRTEIEKAKREFFDGKE